MKPGILKPIVACFIAGVCSAPVALAGQRETPALEASISTDHTEVRPDAVFEVTLQLINHSNVAQSIRVPEFQWDHVWKSSTRLVTWDEWYTYDNSMMTVEIPPHGAYTFPQPLKMFVQSSFHKPHLAFRMGFKPGGGFSKVFWSNTISLDIIPDETGGE